METTRIYNTPEEMTAFKRGFNEGYEYRMKEVNETGLQQGIAFVNKALYRGFVVGVLVTFITCLIINYLSK